jgi:hypothetical protein
MRSFLGGEVVDILRVLMRVLGLLWRSTVWARLGLVRFERAFIQRVWLFSSVGFMSLYFVPILVAKCGRADE